MDINNVFLYGSIEEEMYMSLRQRYFKKMVIKYANLLSHLMDLDKHQENEMKN